MGGGIAEVSNGALLCCYLESAQICDLEMERFLSMVRFTLLDAASGGNELMSTEEGVLNLYCALARQCFINEYVFLLGLMLMPCKLAICETRW
jgi:hypothetical protein